MKLFEIIDDKIQVSNDVSDYLLEIETKESEILNLKKKLRDELLEGLIKYNIKFVKIPNYEIKQVIPKPIIIFKSEEFKKNVDKEIYDEFVDVKNEKYFDIEKLKEENLEIYQKYIVNETVETINEEKLKKTLPTLYNKFLTEQKNNKPITLRITKI